jgi:hypothetical protein
MKLISHSLKIILVAFVAAYCVDYLRAYRLGVAIESELVAAAANPVTRAPKGTSIGIAASRVRKSLQAAEVSWQERGLKLRTGVASEDGVVTVVGESELETWVFRYIGQPTLKISRKRTFRFQSQ